MAISIAARKAKGRRCQQLVRDAIQAELSLLPGDIESTPMGVSGPDIKRSPMVRIRFPFVVGCTWDENKSIWHCVKKTLKIKKDVETDEPLTVMMKNFETPKVVIDLRWFMKHWGEFDKLKYPQYQLQGVLNVS